MHASCAGQGNILAASRSAALAREAYAEAAELDGRCFHAHYNHGQAPSPVRLASTQRVNDVYQLHMNCPICTVDVKHTGSMPEVF